MATPINPIELTISQLELAVKGIDIAIANKTAEIVKNFEQEKTKSLDDIQKKIKNLNDLLAKREASILQKFENSKKNALEPLIKSKDEFSQALEFKKAWEENKAKEEKEKAFLNKVTPFMDRMAKRASVVFETSENYNNNYAASCILRMIRDKKITPSIHGNGTTYFHTPQVLEDAKRAAISSSLYRYNKIYGNRYSCDYYYNIVYNALQKIKVILGCEWSPSYSGLVENL